MLNVIKHGQTDAAFVNLRPTTNASLELTVEDHGAGCDQARLRKAENSSTGFGLFSIQQRAALLGGAFSIVTSPGHGCRITLCIPAGATPDGGGGAWSGGESDADPQSGPEHSAGSPPAPRIRVLVVDDHRIVREGIVGLLVTHADIEVVGQAENGRAAVELSRQLRPDAIVMDISMPIMDGIDATRSIKRELPETRVIGMSMYDKQDLADAMLAAGASVYLTKSGPPETLIDALRRRDVP